MEFRAFRLQEYYIQGEYSSMSRKQFIRGACFALLIAIAGGLIAAGEEPEQHGLRIKPALQVVTPVSISIMWESHTADTGTVKVSTSSSMSSPQTLSTGSAKTHKITVNGLTPNTRYYYTVQSDGETSPVNSFITALPKGSRTPFRFIVYGDTRRAHWAEDIVSKYGDNDDHLAVIDSMQSYAPDFLLGVGDYAFSGNDMDDIYNFFDVEKSLLGNYPLLPAYGNHEFKRGNDTGNTLIDSYFIPASGGTFSYYSYNYGNVHILVLNTGYGVLKTDNYDVIAPGSPQHNFALADLQAAQQDPDVDHIFVAFHNAIYSVAGFRDNNKLRDSLTGMFKTYGVKAVFYGHEHDYQHLKKDGIHYLLSGGGGSSILDIITYKSQAELIKYDDVLNYIVVDVDGENLNIEARSVQGNGNNASARIENFML